MINDIGIAVTMTTGSYLQYAPGRFVLRYPRLLPAGDFGQASQALTQLFVGHGVVGQFAV
jgi:hypothetical protein